MIAEATSQESCITCIAHAARSCGRRVGLGYDDCEDCVSILWLRLWRSGHWCMPLDRGCSSCRPYVWTSARNAALSFARVVHRRAISECSESCELPLHGPQAAPECHTCPDVVTQRSATAAVVTEALTELAPRQADMLVWHYFDGQTAHDISHRLGLSPAAVEQCLHRARRALKKRLVAAGLLVEQPRNDPV